MALFHTLFCILLVVLCCVSLNGGDAVGAVSDAAADVNKILGASVKDSPRNLPCPDATAIYPCVCTADDEFIMDLDCSDVASGEQLAQITGKITSFESFRSLIISSNNKLTALRAGDLGKTTFKNFFITNGVLEVVEVGALSGSYSTATTFDFHSNAIKSFLWEEIDYFTNLETLNVKSNRISVFPTLRLDNLFTLQFSYNPIGSLPSTAFDQTPDLGVIELANTALHHIVPGTFNNLPFLYSLNLNANSLTELLANSVQMGSYFNNYVTLQYNTISTVEVNAISGLRTSDEVNLNNNQLMLVEEEVWRPLLQEGVNLDLVDNPLECGCDIAWIILNTDYLNLVNERTTCSSGERLVDLDPEIFKNNCN